MGQGRGGGRRWGEEPSARGNDEGEGLGADVRGLFWQRTSPWSCSTGGLWAQQESTRTRFASGDNGSGCRGEKGLRRGEGRWARDLRRDSGGWRSGSLGDHGPDQQDGRAASEGKTYPGRSRGRTDGGRRREGRNGWRSAFQPQALVAPALLGRRWRQAEGDLSRLADPESSGSRDRKRSLVGPSAQPRAPSKS